VTGQTPQASLTSPQRSRLLQLCDAGLSDAAVTIVLRLDYPGIVLNATSVRAVRRDDYRANGTRRAPVLVHVSKANGGNFS
jgi:ligand-binding sensor protein